jgi:hypothetical protein
MTDQNVRADGDGVALLRRAGFRDGNVRPNGFPEPT